MKINRLCYARGMKIFSWFINWRNTFFKWFYNKKNSFSRPEKTQGFLLMIFFDQEKIPLQILVQNLNRVFYLYNNVLRITFLLFPRKNIYKIPRSHLWRKSRELEPQKLHSDQLAKLPFNPFKRGHATLQGQLVYSFEWTPFWIPFDCILRRKSELRCSVPFE